MIIHEKGVGFFFKVECDYWEKLKFVFVVFSRHHSSNKIHAFNYSLQQSLFSETLVVSSQSGSEAPWGFYLPQYLQVPTQFFFM